MPENERRLLSKVMPGLLRPGGLQGLAAAALERTLAADPDDADALWKLAEVYRRLWGTSTRRAACMGACAAPTGARPLGCMRC